MSAIAGKRILIVEDEALIAAMLGDVLADYDAVAVGPASTVAAGVRLAQTETLDGAVLDVNLHGEWIDPVAEALVARRVPFVFVSGYGRSPRTDRFAAPMVDKPYLPDTLVAEIARAMAAAAPDLVD